MKSNDKLQLELTNMCITGTIDVQIEYLQTLFPSKPIKPLRPKMLPKNLTEAKLLVELLEKYEIDFDLYEKKLETYEVEKVKKGDLLKQYICSEGGLFDIPEKYRKKVYYKAYQRSGYYSIYQELDELTDLFL